MPINRPIIPNFPRCTLDQYKNDPGLVKALNDAQLDFLETMLKEKSVIEDKFRAATNENRNLKQQAHKENRKSIIQSCCLIVGGILFGIGVSVATSSPHDWPGWVLSVAGSMLQLFSLVVVAL